MPQMETRTLTVGQYQVRYREWTRREVKALDESDLEDFMVGTVIRQVAVTDPDDADAEPEIVDPDDIPYQDLVSIIVAIGEGLAPNGRRGSAQRRQTRR